MTKRTGGRFPWAARGCVRHLSSFAHGVGVRQKSSTRCPMAGLDNTRLLLHYATRLRLQLQADADLVVVIEVVNGDVQRHHALPTQQRVID